MKHFTSLNLIFSALLIIGFGCAKKKTLELNVHVESDLTGQAISNALVSVSYFRKKDSDDDIQTMELGRTDADGNLAVKEKIKGRSFNHSIRVFADGYGKRIAENLAYKIPIEIGESVDQNIRLKPVYHYLVTTKNMTCLTSQDSVWVSTSDGMKGLTVGCLPVVMHYADYSGFPFTYWTIGDEVTFNVKVKKVNGSVTSYAYHTFTKTLTEAEITPVTLSF